MYTQEYSQEDKKEMNSLLKISDDHIKVSEIFATIQGEGINTGIPVIFIRLQLCNLQCIWCDTGYTWNWEGTSFEHDTKDYEQKKYDPRKEIKIMTAKQVVHEVEKVSANKKINHIVLTGGEPLMHQKSKAFYDMINMLSYKYIIEVETNGTLVPEDWLIKYILRFNVSPKLENSNNSISSRERKKPYEHFAEIHNSIFKFVISNKKDLKEIEELVKKYYIPSNKILLMPEGRTDEELREKAQWLVDICIEKGYRFCNRLHAWVWDGALRGV